MDIPSRSFIRANESVGIISGDAPSPISRCTKKIAVVEREFRQALLWKESLAFASLRLESCFLHAKRMVSIWQAGETLIVRRVSQTARLNPVPLLTIVTMPAGTTVPLGSVIVPKRSGAGFVATRILKMRPASGPAECPAI